MKRFLLMLLVCAMLAACLAGCAEQPGPATEPVSGSSASGSSSGTSSDTAPQGGADDAPRYDAKGYLMDDLPSDLNFDADIRVLHWTEADLFNPDKDETAFVDHSVYTRNLNVEDRLGITFEWVPAQGHWPSEQSFLTNVQNAYINGEQSRYDIIATYSQTAGLISTQGLVIDLYSVDHIDLEKPWWPSSLTADFTIGDKLWFASGDVSPAFLGEMVGVLFNKTLLKNDNLYELVYDGTWTQDKMLELAKNFYVDLNDSEKKDTGDRFGIVIPWYIYLDAFFYASDLITVENNDDHLLCVSSTYVSEKADNLSEVLKTFFHKTDDGLLADGEENIHIFANGRSAFMVCPGATIMGTMSMRETRVEYGVVPVPKYDADQKEYKTTITNLYSLYTIFAGSTKEQANRAGAVIECLASEGYRTVSPMVFEVCLKTRYTNDDDSAKMYDIIHDGVVFDVGRVFSRSALKDITQSRWQRCVIDGDKVWGAMSATIDAQMQNLLDNLMETFNNLPDPFIES